jgi:hypothetical protein
VAQLQGIEHLSDTMKTFVQVVREYMRDHPELNRLIAGQETNNRLIAWSVLDALSLFNGTPHFTNYSLEQLLGMNQQSSPFWSLWACCRRAITSTTLTED